MTTQQWFVYFLRCEDNSLYAGVTTDIDRRLHEHNHTKKGAKYTRVRRPVVLAYKEVQLTRQLACQREYLLRKLPKYKKEKLIQEYQQEKSTRVS